VRTNRTPFRIRGLALAPLPFVRTSITGHKPDSQVRLTGQPQIVEGDMTLAPAAICGAGDLDLRTAALPYLLSRKAIIAHSPPLPNASLSPQEIC
jgi:hypothetical protein